MMTIINNHLSLGQTEKHTSPLRRFLVLRINAASFQRMQLLFKEAGCNFFSSVFQTVLLYNVVVSVAIRV